MVVSIRALLRSCPAPGPTAIRAGIAGNLCRCTGYVNLLRAVERVIAERSAAGAAGSAADTGNEGAPHP
jgi:carbon-monoxide dehydrogenase small subunit